MNALSRLVTAAFIITLAAGPTQAKEIDGRKGIGYAEAIGGPQGLAFNYVVGNLILEGILGIQFESFDSDALDSEFNLGVGVGAHFALLRADNAFVTAGGRINIQNGKVASIAGTQESVTQFGFDVPVRVYWFPDEHFSLHFETGISVLIGPDEGTFNPDVTPKGFALNIFEGSGSAFGGLGATFWW